MAFCTNCGHPLSSGVKFCPSCGTRVAVAPPEAKTRGYKERMVKGVEQRLKTTLQGQARSAVQKVFSRAAGEARRQAGAAFSDNFNPSASGGPFSETGREIREPFGERSTRTSTPDPGSPSGKSKNGVPEEAIPENPGKGVSGWIWIFLLLSILLGVLAAMQGFMVYGILRILALSAVILLLVLARKNKPKPMNWLVKILLLAQVALLGYVLYNRIMGQYFDVSALVMAALFSTGLRLLFIGNRR